MAIFQGPIKCSCGATYYIIQQDSSNHTSLCAFRCPNWKCRRKFPIRINSFYASFNYIPLTVLTVVSKVIYCFLCNQFNAEKALNFINSNINYNTSKNVIYKIYSSMRSIIYRYMRFVYEKNLLLKKMEMVFIQFMNL